MDWYGLSGKLTAVDGRRDELLAHLLAAAELMADQPGCELYLVSTSPDDANAVFITELWRSQADHAASLQRDDVRELIGQARPLLAGAPEGVRLHPAGGKGLPGS